MSRNLTRSWPALIRLRDIPAPILPRPINPTFMMSSSWSNHSKRMLFWGALRGHPMSGGEILDDPTPAKWPGRHTVTPAVVDMSHTGLNADRPDPRLQLMFFLPSLDR